MARKKVSLAWIVNDATRKATFKKRRKGPIKMVNELSVLCGVRACAIIFAPHEARPEVCPSMEGAMDVLARFKSLPEMEQSKKMMNQETFIRQQTAKLSETLRKHERHNRELQLGILLHQGIASRSVHDFGIQDTTSLAWIIEMKIKSVKGRIEQAKLHDAVAAAGAPPLPLPPTGQQLAAAREKAQLDAAIAEMQSQNCWLIDDQNVGFGNNGVQGGAMQSYMDHSTPWPEPFFPSN